MTLAVFLIAALFIVSIGLVLLVPWLFSIFLPQSADIVPVEVSLQMQGELRLWLGLLPLLALFVLLPVIYWGVGRFIKLEGDGDVKIEESLHKDVPENPHGIISSSIEDSEEAEALLTRDRLTQLVDSGLLMSLEKNQESLLWHILFTGKELCHCDVGTIYLKTERNTLAFALRTKHDHLPNYEVPLEDPETGEPNDHHVSAYVALNNETVNIVDVYEETRFNLSGTREFDASTDYRSVSMLTVPLATRENEILGVLQFINALNPATGEVVPFSKDLIGLVETLADHAAIALENQQLFQGQQDLIESLIKITAGAIDAKSEYTGGHCARVPELAVMLAEQASETKEGPLADFGFDSEDEWREFRIAAWLHDCGKVTTPEYVVDKATKLETIYDRIHEIRSRFEILLRDAEIQSLKAIAAGVDRHTAKSDLEREKQQLQDDFEFVARCNIGSEYMADADKERISQISKRQWQRHFDDRLGLSQDELMRYKEVPIAKLPVTEQLLADKVSHQISRREDQRNFDPRFGFTMDVPEHLYDLGEIKNLSVDRGTLTAEERYKCNEHIIQTIMMLESLPLPKNLQRIPEIAGNHHETLIGTGYPRGLTADELCIPSRIMAIADIFEALTAYDRPYKKPKALSEAIELLHKFKKKQHIDPDLFDLFLTSGVYLRYAEEFLDADQIDHVDIDNYIG